MQYSFKGAFKLLFFPAQHFKSFWHLLPHFTFVLHWNYEVLTFKSLKIVKCIIYSIHLEFMYFLSYNHHSVTFPIRRIGSKCQILWRFVTFMGKRKLLFDLLVSEYKYMQIVRIYERKWLIRKVIFICNACNLYVSKSG